MPKWLCRKQQNRGWSIMYEHEFLLDHNFNFACTLTAFCSRLLLFIIINLLLLYHHHIFCSTHMISDWWNSITSISTKLFIVLLDYIHAYPSPKYFLCELLVKLVVLSDKPPSSFICVEGERYERKKAAAYYATFNTINN